MSGLRARLGSTWVVVLVGLMLGGCSSTALNQAPVVDRGAGVVRPGVMDPTTQAVKQLPGFENAGKPGYYTVKPGDTLIRIGLDHGQAAKDIARWSSIDDPNRIEIGQIVRVVPPTGSATGGSGARPVAAVTVAPTPNTASTAPATSSASATANSEDEINWIWPTNGPVLAGFDEVKNKGLDIGGKAGDPVLAAADGRVVYVGAGLRGYGNLVILKHNNTYLTAYAHNRTLLIKEDQAVRKGQKIAEMGSSDADRVKLHFEVRRQGKPVDPARYLPAR